MATRIERFEAAYTYLLENGGHGRPLGVTEALGFSILDGEVSLLATGDTNPDPAQRAFGSTIAYLWGNEPRAFDATDEMQGYREGWLVNVWRPHGEDRLVVKIGQNALVEGMGIGGRPLLDHTPADIPSGSQEIAEESVMVLIEDAIAAHGRAQGASGES
jgi:hypothetical protein